ncbi:MAG TPA: M1 family aminopeptidase [Thermoanaerobaculia bacterium]|nr:M1 family aminopeptidase [Thermoanaerobaculia bacterium]
MLAPSLAAAPAFAGALAARAAIIDAPRRSAEIAMSGPLQIGRGEITLAARTHAYALLAAGAPCGLLIDGPATLRYRVEDRFSLPVAKRNVERASKLGAKLDGEALVITSSLDGAVIWGWGLGDGERAHPPAPEVLASAARRIELADWAAEILAGRRFQPPSHGLLAEEANGGTGRRYALLHGEDEDLLLHVDPVEGEENLYKLVRSRDPGQTFRQGFGSVPLAAQPIGRQWWAPPRRQLVAVHEAMHVDNPVGDQLNLVTRSRLEAHSGGAGIWQAQLVDVITDASGRRLPVTVHGVRVDGKEADFLHQDDELLVAFGRRLGEGQTVEVEVTYEGPLAQRPAGHSYWVLGTWPWYPRQALDGELATMDIEVDVPAELMPFASGSQVELAVTGKRRRLVTRLDRAMQYAVVAAGKYELVAATAEGVTCRAATYAMPNEKAAQQLLAKFFSGRRMLEQIFDQPYPFHDFSIVQLEDWGFGQAPPGIIFFTREFYTAPVDRRTRGYFQDLDSRVLHEIAHGWWGHVAKMGSSSEAWWTESLADYTAALALWRLRGGKPGAHAFDEIVLDWRRSASDLAPGASLYLADRLAFTSDRNIDDYWRLRYGKGPLVIHALRLELQRLKGSIEEGDRFFIAFLRTFLKRNPYGIATTPDMVATLHELTGTDWQPWFERFVYGTEIPQLPK